MIEKHLKITGRVQGVGYRHFTRQAAHKLGIKGWVKNMSDGSVETVIAGRKEDVEVMMDQLEKGPISAKVSNIAVLNNSLTGEKFDNFNVRR